MWSLEDFWDRIKGAANGVPGTMPKPSGSILGATVRGGLSAVAPIEAMPELIKSETEVAAREGLIGLSAAERTAQKVELTAWEKMTTRTTRSVVRKGGQMAGRWAGPIFTAYRLGTEVGTQGQGLGQAASKSVRIVGEEIIGTAAFTGGMAIGGKIGATLGTMIAPGVGTAIGTVAGMAIGAVGSIVGSWAWNKTVDAAEAPIRMAQAGWKYFAAAGKRSTQMELGGRRSIANSSRVAYTMRSRALQQMSRSGINARSLLGHEASYMHIR